MKLKKYRVVRDGYAGFECQIWRLWFPFWVQMDFVNTFMTLERAIEFIESRGVVWQSDKPEYAPNASLKKYTP